MPDQTMPSTQNSPRVTRDGTQADTSQQGRTLRQQAEDAAADAKRKAEQLGENASQTAREEASRAADRARELAAQVTGEAASIADQTISRVRETADEAIVQQRDRAKGFVGSIENAVEAAARSLHEDGYGQMANYVRYASSTLSSINDEVGSFEPQRLTGRAERAARRNPLITYGALAVAGFALVTLMNSQNRR